MFWYAQSGQDDSQVHIRPRPGPDNSHEIHNRDWSKSGFGSYQNGLDQASVRPVKSSNQHINMRAR